ncbi:PREDICTED: B-box zinc finger protein 20 [Nicotiana attenuata]|uniref:B-box zinc finger protein 20 n=1 Tax=Nicotiana attenuata TaxID=49451 RepID=A0A1J6JY46_NICAT|nr:PREDICTED: B-box zinc finger protein 20 [Nicotiana attenuata]OIT22693.1 b-box zinc finger protein 20 [Nicotiana attenuata]
MKIQCEICDKEEASIYCSADEATLCQRCDYQVHHANKLASKHLRFSLIHPSFKDSPRCDICQERRALLFCKEDRAILCKECDLHIHKANEHTKKHNRFLLTGVQLSSAVASYNQTSSSSSPTGSAASNAENYISCTSSSGILKGNSTVESTPNFQEGSVSTSSISEYLIETLPGWHVEDFLEYPCSSHYEF